MSLLTNNNTIHLYNRWISPWYENNPVYSNLIYSDLYIYEFINGIYYQLKMPSSIIDIKELNFNQIIVRLNLYLFKKRKQKRSSLFFNNKSDFFIFYKKMSYLLHKIIFINRQYKKRNKYNIFLFNLKKVKKKIRKKNIILLLNIKKKVNTIKKLNYFKHKYKKHLKIKDNKNLKNKKTKLFLIGKHICNSKLNSQLICNFFLSIYGVNYLNNCNKDLYIIYLGNYYKTYNFKNKYSKITKYNNKNLLKYYFYIKKKKIYSMKNILRGKKYHKLNSWYKNKKKTKNKLKMIKKKKIFYIKKLKNRKNKKMFFNKNFRIHFLKNRKIKRFFRVLSKYRIKRKNFNNLSALKTKIYRNIFNKCNRLRKYINRKQIHKFLYYFNKRKHKLNNINYDRKKIYLKKKLFLTSRKLTLRRYKNKVRKRRRKKKKNRKLYLKVKKKKKKLIRKLFRRFKIKKKKLEKKPRKYKKKKSKKLRRNLINKNISFYLFFWIYKKIVKWYYLLVIKSLLVNRLLFFSKKIIISLNFCFSIMNLNTTKNKILTKNINSPLNKLIYLNKRKIQRNYHWFNNFYLRLMLYHLRLKISDTLSKYLHSNIIFFPYYKKKFYVLQDVKLMCDFIKLKLQYGRSIVRILRKIIRVHNYQRFKLRVRSKRYRLKMIFFKLKIRNRIIRKFRLINSRNNLLLEKDKDKKSIKKYKFKCNKKIKINDFKKLNGRLKSSIYINKLNLKLFENNNIFNLNNNNFKLYIKLNNLIKRRKKQNKRKKRIRLMKRLTKWRKKFKYLNYKHYPLIGIRIECNGPSKKGRRTKMITYNEWVNYYKLPGKMPYSTKMADVHYWQNYARTKRAAIGIKVWLFFNTLLNGLNIGKARKNIKYKL